MHESDDEPAEAEDYHGDMTIVARHLTPTEAHLLAACLEASGLPAEVGDANMVQADFLLAAAMGGARVSVHRDFVNEARGVIAAFHRGEFTLDDNFDVGANEHPC